MTGRGKQARAEARATEARLGSDSREGPSSRGWMGWLALGLAIVAGLVYRNEVIHRDPPGTSETMAVDLELRRLVEGHVRQVQEDPSAANHGALGLVYEANGLWSEAERCFESASELDPLDPSWELHRGIVVAEQGDLETARVHFERAVAAREDSAAARFRLADALQRSGRLEPALEHFHAAARLMPESAEAHTGLGAALFEKKELEAARASLARAVELDGSYRSAHYQLGRVLSALGRKEEATSELALGVDALKRYVPDPLEERIRSLRVGFSSQLDGALALLQSGRAREGIAVLEQLQAQRPDDVKVLNNLAAAYIDNGAHPKALPLLVRARELDENEFATWINLSSWAQREKRLDEALAHAEHAVRLAGNVGRAHLVRGTALLALRRREEAYASLRLAADLDARNPQVQTMLGALCVDLGRREEAEAALQTANRLAPTALDPLFLQVRLYVTTGEIAQARAALDAARRLAPRHPKIPALEGLLAPPTAVKGAGQ